MASRNQPVGDLAWVVGWLAVLWLVLLVEAVVLHVSGNSFDLRWFGVRPREPIGLLGIVTAPFLHADPSHLAANSVGLLITGYAGCKESRALTLVAAGYAALVGGMITWLIGEPGTTHIGASGVIFGLIGFLMLNGVVRRGCLPFALAVLTVLLFGGSIKAGLMPDQHGPLKVSWQMHLGGFLGGLFASWHLRREKG